MKLYYAYGFFIESDIALSTKVVIGEKSDIQVKIANLAGENIRVTNDSESNRIFCKLPGVAKFLIKDGTEILIDPEPEIDPAVLSPCILNSAMSVLLQQRGFLVLHASCVVVDGVAVAFLGNSGDGKSTICGAFHAGGYEILTDDVMAICLDRDDIRVLPSIPEIKLRSDSAASMNYSGGSLSPLHPFTKKKVHQVDAGFSVRPIPLKQIYILAKGEQNQIQALSTQEAFVGLIRHTRAVKILRNKNLDREHFQRCATIAQKISISKLVRKFALTELSNLVKLIEQHAIDSLTTSVK